MKKLMMMSMMALGATSAWANMEIVPSDPLETSSADKRPATARRDGTEGKGNCPLFPEAPECARWSNLSFAASGAGSVSYPRSHNRYMPEVVVDAIRNTAVGESPCLDAEARMKGEYLSERTAYFNFQAGSKSFDETPWVSQCLGFDRLTFESPEAQREAYDETMERFRDNLNDSFSRLYLDQHGLRSFGRLDKNVGQRQVATLIEYMSSFVARNVTKRK